jgi:hypothetical protein
VEIKINPICLTCKESVFVLKEYNKQHYETKHANKCDTYKGKFRQDQVVTLKKTISAKQKYLLERVKCQHAVR